MERAGSDIRLIATDLDGTLIGGADEMPLYEDFRDRVDALRDSNGTVWAACSGRSMSSFREFFRPMRTMGIKPDYIVVSHAYIHSRTSAGYMPHLFWSLEIRFRTWTMLWRVRRELDQWRRMLRAGARGVLTLRRRKFRMSVRFDTENSAVYAADMLKQRARAYPCLQVFQRMNEVDVIVVPFTKGLAVAEMARHLKLRPDQILAMGNGHNDLSMFDAQVAGFTGCPANSDPEVIRAVHERGGHISRSSTLAGVLDIIDATMSGAVSSELPAGLDAEERAYQHSIKRDSRRHGRRGSKRNLWLFLAVAYVVITVFASFNLMPFSAAIMKPIWMLLRLVEKVLSYLFALSQ